MSFKCCCVAGVLQMASSGTVKVRRELEAGLEWRRRRRRRRSRGRYSSHDWSVGCTTAILASIQTNFGYSHDSSPVQYLVDVMCEMSADEKRQFLLFVCGTPKLPIGGFRNLNPRMTVVRKENDDDLPPDQYLPSVMTCANYIKLPAYSSKEVLRSRLLLAIAEGQSAFHLS